MSRVIRPLFALSALFVAMSACAEGPGPEPDYAIAYNVGALTDYRVRGIAQTSKNPAVQGGIDLTLKNGLYAGTFLSNVEWVKHFNGATKGSVEVDLYGGFRDAINSDWSFDTGVITYQYPGNNSGAANTPGGGLFANANTGEAYLQLTYKIANFKYNRSLGNFLGNINSTGSQYFDLNCTVDLGNGFAFTPHIGRQLIPNQGAGGNAGDYTDYAASIAKDFGNGLVVTATVMTTTATGNPFYRDFDGRDLAGSVGLLGAKYSF